MDVEKAWDSSKYIEKTIVSMNAAQCLEYMNRLKWLENNPIALPSISDIVFTVREKRKQK